MSDNLLATNRLNLKAPELNHAPFLLDFENRNLHFFQVWTPKREEKFYTLDHQIIRIKSSLDLLEKGQLQEWLVFEKGEKEDQIIGQIQYGNIIRGPLQSCFVGYKLDEQKTGKGYMQEALQATNQVIFQELKLRRIEANIMPQNGASIRLAEKLGFEREGLAKSYMQINGKWEDMYRYALIT
jgi:ribosomal-protein-alanine N-acetyltransferase